jgi:hypothetical protein
MTLFLKCQPASKNCWLALYYGQILMLFGLKKVVQVDAECALAALSINRTILSEAKVNMYLTIFIFKVALGEWRISV